MLINYVTIFGKRGRGEKIKKVVLCMYYTVCSSSNQVLIP